MRFAKTTLCSILLSMVASTAVAGTDVYQETFNSDVNFGGWTYGPLPQYPATGGNPGKYLRASVDTFAPSLRTTAPNSPFTGNYRSSKVLEIGVDLNTFSTQFPASRECTLVLWSGSNAVYRLGTDLVPQPGTGWKSIDIPVPSQSTTMPAGWLVHPSSSSQGPNATWNNVIQNVTKVEFFYGDPTFFFIFDIWNVGADNISITREDGWSDVGNALAGSNGLPTLSGDGQLLGLQPVSISLGNALPNSTAFLLVGFAQANLPFMGGILVPDVSTTGIALPLPTGPTGGFTLGTVFPSGLPSGTNVVLQFWIQDAGGPLGVAASNGLVGLVP